MGRISQFLRFRIQLDLSKPLARCNKFVMDLRFYDVFERLGEILVLILKSDYTIALARRFKEAKLVEILDHSSPYEPT